MSRRRRFKRRRLLVMPLSRLFPNMVTLAGMCCGLSAIRFSLEAHYETAVALLVVAAIIDGMDGRIARFLNSTSMFGAQLDSLSDFVCFGISPVVVLYIWRLHGIKGFGWAMVLFFAICCALRLARFNTNLSDESRQPWQMKFFTGIPSPAGAMLSLMPLVTSFYAENDFFDSVWFCLIWVPVVGILMASRVPTFAAKNVKVHHEWVLPIMLVCGFILVCTVIMPWLMFNLCGLVYLLMIPVSVRRYRKLAQIHKGSPMPPLTTIEFSEAE